MYIARAKIAGMGGTCCRNDRPVESHTSPNQVLTEAAPEWDLTPVIPCGNEEEGAKLTEVQAYRE